MTRSTLMVLAAAALLIGMPQMAAAESELPSPGIAPPEANDPDCRPTADRPPVVLLHGTRSDMTINWQYMSPRLAEGGWCVWALDFENRAQVRVERSADRLAQFVDHVLAVTGAEHVSLVGHSLGGLIARQYVRFHGGLGVVDDIVSLGTPQYGYHSEPPFDEVDKVFNTGCEACDQIAQGSEFLAALNAGDPTPAPTSYTQLITRNDGVATPVENQELPASERSVNIWLEDACPDHPYEHLTLAIDPLVLDWTVNALGRPGPADPARAVDCSPLPFR